jgi:proton glutamate symport protein
LELAWQILIAITLGAMGLPVEGLAFIAGVDRLMDMASTSAAIRWQPS